MKKIFYFLLCLPFLSITSSALATDVGGSITTDTTWTAAGSPYIVLQNVEVKDGVTLTIEPGTKIAFYQETDQKLDKLFGLSVMGTAKLIAQGTAEAPIVFTSASPSPKPGDWASVNVFGTDNVIEHVIFEYGAGDIGYDAALVTDTKNLSHLTVRNNRKGLLISGDSVTIEDSSFFFNGSYMVLTHANSTSLINCTFDSNKDDIIDSFGSVMVDNCTFTNNEGEVFPSHYGELTITNSIFENNTSPYGEASIINFLGGSLILRNTLICNNKGKSAIYIQNYEAEEDSVTIENCTITYNGPVSTSSSDGDGIYYNGAAGESFSMSNTNIFGNSRYDFMNDGEADVTIPNNYWGSNDNLQIMLKIYDKFDGQNKGEVIYQPYLPSLSSAAPAPCNPLTSTTTTTTIPGGTTTTTIPGGTTTTTTPKPPPCAAEEIYGEQSEQTELLRKYRDDVLSKTFEGQEIIKTYYKFSPTATKLLEQNPLLKNWAKAYIDSMLPGIKKKVEESNKEP